MPEQHHTDDEQWLQRVVAPDGDVPPNHSVLCSHFLPAVGVGNCLGLKPAWPPLPWSVPVLLSGSEASRLASFGDGGAAQLN